MLTVLESESSDNVPGNDGFRDAILSSPVRFGGHFPRSPGDFSCGSPLPMTTTPMAGFGPVQVYFGEKNGKYPDGNQVVIRGSDTLAAFDTPLVANRIGEVLAPVDLVMLSHAHEDHMAGLHRLAHAQVYVHEHDADAARSWPGLAAHYGLSPASLPAMHDKIVTEFHYVPRPDAIAYPDGHVWELGGVRIHAVHLPGHTAGHCALLVEPGGILFIGDIDLSGFGPYYGDASSDLAAFRQSLARLAGIDANVWVTSHHRGVYTDRARFAAALRAYAAKLDERNQRLLDLLRAAPRSLEELVHERLIYPPEYQEIWVVDAERRTIGLHLDELLAQERIRQDETGRYVVRVAS